MHNNKPLTIGIVACSAEGAALCYRTICSSASEIMGKHAHPNIVLHSVSLADYVEALDAGDHQAVADIMLHSANQLALAGADFLVCPDNTIHSAMGLVRPGSPLPWLHIAEVVADEALRQGYQKPCILGTKWLVESEVYPQALAAVGIDFMRPESEERMKISQIIMDELVNDVQRESSIEYFQNLIETMKAEVVMLLFLAAPKFQSSSMIITLRFLRLIVHGCSRKRPCNMRYQNKPHA